MLACQQEENQFQCGEKNNTLGKKENSKNNLVEHLISQTQTH